MKKHDIYPASKDINVSNRDACSINEFPRHYNVLYKVNFILQFISKNFDSK